LYRLISGESLELKELTRTNTFLGPPLSRDGKLVLDWLTGI
jgi:hypothetical protein